jgi:hypothetical protein
MVTQLCSSSSLELNAAQQQRQAMQAWSKQVLGEQNGEEG